MDSLTRRQPLSTLQPTGGDVTVINTEPRRTSNLTNVILWYLGIFVLAYALLYLINPSWVQRTDAITGRANGERDQGKLILWSLGIALIGTLVASALYGKKH